MVDFGKRLRALRLRDNLTQKQLAARIGLTKSVISAYETGLRLPSYDVLLQFSRIFKVSTDHLLGATPSGSATLDLSQLTPAQREALRQLVAAMQ